ncbi:toxin-antitoxin system, antitoxin component, Xre domain protein [Teladorsagia circumcincta]|uniref:Toxin-antitoxin system, antitoxin component, Xre domain protein n=1 Tax=Teladorsagia circumcincta TaxID=45464 RepID=A0A2G9TQE6_TELCI|nr:toxin-antitoxin system, antitoxin component, Xre domain protein [Teladorsagia circumcincta]
MPSLIVRLPVRVVDAFEGSLGLYINLLSQTVPIQSLNSCTPVPSSPEERKHELGQLLRRSRVAPLEAASPATALAAPKKIPERKPASGFQNGK